MTNIYMQVIHMYNFFDVCKYLLLFLIELLDILAMILTYYVYIQDHTYVNFCLSPELNLARFKLTPKAIAAKGFHMF